MIPKQHPSNNHVFGAPGGWDQDKLPCSALPVTLGPTDEGGWAGIMSYWKPTDEELAVLNAGGLVKLTVLGRQHPVVSLGVDSHGTNAAAPAG